MVAVSVVTVSDDDSRTCGITVDLSHCRSLSVAAAAGGNENRVDINGNKQDDPLRISVAGVQSAISRRRHQSGDSTRSGQRTASRIPVPVS